MDVDVLTNTNQDEILSTIRLTHFFSNSSESVIKELSLAVDIISLLDGELLFEKGDEGDSMYIVQSGGVKVHDEGMVFNVIKEGELFGEMAILDDDVRSASITAIANTILIKINKNILQDLIAQVPGLSLSIIHSLCNSMRRRVTEISNEFKHIQELETELKIGREIQSGFLPDKLPELNGWKLVDYFEAARECAGDFYDSFIVKRNNQLAFVIGDVADKGVGSALFMTLFRSLLRASTNVEEYTKEKGFLSNNDSSLPKDLLLRSVNYTNNYIAITHGSSNMFATLFFAMVDLETGELNYINCGHETVEIIGDGCIKYELDTTGPVVGLFPNANYKVKTAYMDVGDILLGYTDGVTEAMNVCKEQYGMTRFRNYLCNTDQPIDNVLSGIESDIRSFTLGAAQSDDITMLALKRESRTSLFSS